VISKLLKFTDDTKIVSKVDRNLKKNINAVSNFSAIRKPAVPTVISEHKHSTTERFSTLNDNRENSKDSIIVSRQY